MKHRLPALSSLRTHRAQLSSIAIIGLFAGLGLFVYLVTPQSIIASLGAQNAYMVLFLTALVSGVTTMSTVPYSVILVSLTLGGLPPVALGAVAASGVILGDTASYYVGYRGTHIIPESFMPRVYRLAGFLERHPRVIPLFFFLFGAVAPLSNDVLTIPLGVARYSFLKLMMPLWAGNVVFNIALAYAAIHFSSFFSTLVS